MPTEITHSDELYNILNSRFEELPISLQRIFLDNSFRKNIHDIANQYEIQGILEKAFINEVILVIFLFEPLSHLTQNLVNQLSITPQKASDIFKELELLIFYGVSDMLYEIEREYSFPQTKNTRTQQENIPPTDPEPSHKTSSIDSFSETTHQDLPESKPLTREELMQRLTPRRTMADDVAISQHTPPQTPLPKPQAQGYEAYQNTQTQGH